MAIYGNTLDSLQGAKLADAEAKVRANAAYRDYLLGLASERNKGRQIDVNAEDAMTRRQDVGSRNQLGNRQIDLGGREVDMRGEDIRSRERIAGQDADVRRAALEVDKAYKAGLITDLERGRKMQELGITTTAGLRGREIDLTRDEMTKRYGLLGDRLGLDTKAEENRLELGRSGLGIQAVDAATRAQEAGTRRELGLGALDVAKRDAETRATEVKNRYDLEIRSLEQRGLFKEADLMIARRDQDIRKELGLGALEQQAIGNAMTYDINNRGMILNEKSNPARIGLLESQGRSFGTPSEAYRLEQNRDAVANAGRRNRASMVIKDAKRRYDGERSKFLPSDWWNRDQPMSKHLLDAAKEIGDPSLLDYIQLSPNDDEAMLMDGQIPGAIQQPLSPRTIPGVIDSNAPPGRVMYRVGPDGRLVQ